MEQSHQNDEQAHENATHHDHPEQNTAPARFARCSRSTATVNHSDVIPRMTLPHRYSPAPGYHTESFTPSKNAPSSERFFTEPGWTGVRHRESAGGRQRRSVRSIQPLAEVGASPVPRRVPTTAPEVGIKAIADRLGDDDPIVNLKRAEDLYDRVFTQFGDDSVAQLGGAHLACEQASNILTKVLEWGRLASYLEQSTRYIFYDRKLGDRYRYRVPTEISGTSPGEPTTGRPIDSLFDTYTELIGRAVPYYETLFPKADDDSAFVWRSTIRAKACDDLRGDCSPRRRRRTSASSGAGRPMKSLLMRMQAHPLAEARDYGQMMLIELRKVIPAFLKRVDVPARGGAWSEYLATTAAAVEESDCGLSTCPLEDQARGDPRRLGPRCRDEDRRGHAVRGHRSPR